MKLAMGILEGIALVCSILLGMFGKYDSASFILLLLIFGNTL